MNRRIVKVNGNIRRKWVGEIRKQGTKGKIRSGAERMKNDKEETGV